MGRNRGYIGPERWRVLPPTQCRFIQSYPQFGKRRRSGRPSGLHLGLNINDARKAPMAIVNETALSAAWQELEASLREANKLFLNRADGGRAAAFYQLSAVNRFISSVADNDRLLQIPLFALNVALHYLGLGVVEPMLAPAGKSRRGRRPEQGVLKVRSAVAMSQLYGIGYRRKEAARRIANELTKLGCQTSADAVADWRDHFKGLPASDPNGELYRSMLANESHFIARSTDVPGVEEDARPKLEREIMDTFRKFVLLARLTSNPNLSRVSLKLSKRART